MGFRFVLCVVCVIARASQFWISLGFVSYWLRNYIANISLFYETRGRQEKEKTIQHPKPNEKRKKLCYKIYPFLALCVCVCLLRISVPFLLLVWMATFTICSFGDDWTPISTFRWSERQVKHFFYAQKYNQPQNQSIPKKIMRAVIIYQFMYLMHLIVLFPYVWLPQFLGI